MTFAQRLIWFNSTSQLSINWLWVPKGVTLPKKINSNVNIGVCSDILLALVKNDSIDRAIYGRTPFLHYLFHEAHHQSLGSSSIRGTQSGIFAGKSSTQTSESEHRSIFGIFRWYNKLQNFTRN